MMNKDEDCICFYRDAVIAGHDDPAAVTMRRFNLSRDYTVRLLTRPSHDAMVKISATGTDESGRRSRHFFRACHHIELNRNRCEATRALVLGSPILKNMRVFTVAAGMPIICAERPYPASTEQSIFQPGTAPRAMGPLGRRLNFYPGKSRCCFGPLQGLVVPTGQGVSSEHHPQRNLRAVLRLEEYNGSIMEWPNA